VIKHKLIEPRVRTEASLPLEQTTSGRLPDALVSEQVQRLGFCTVVGVGLWTYGLAMDTSSGRSPSRPSSRERTSPSRWFHRASGLMFLYVRYGPHTSSTKIDAGLVYFVLNAVGVSLLNTWAFTPGNEAAGRLSWTTIVILLSAMIMPTSPRKMLATSLAAATMDPLAVWVGHLRGLPVPSVLNTFVLFMPNYACAIFAVLPSQVLARLGNRLRHAQELGSYHLVELLGRGGMGEVWRGRHRLLARSASLVRLELLERAAKSRPSTCCTGSSRKHRPRPR
jgi:serine/threonine-protein kinase